ncbi:hypothetical protein TWF694_008259 [Orbilia ellipsospora]|uniref:Ricin B lectin domain-containing protein n=1 Tax=Orbilia ellipsospora TaxID=2528407 RepID=A0AAV9XH32_9PEZI
MYSNNVCLIALSFSTAIVSASPLWIPRPRAVTSLDQAATAEAHTRDNTATRAFSSITINTSNGKCLFVDPLGGDFRANLIPVLIKDCDGSDNEKWDIITKGVHNDQLGTMLIVNTLVQGCLNFDPRRAAGDQVNIFSCGGRADGSGQVTNSQLFNFTTVSSGPLPLQPLNQVGTCLTSAGARLDQTTCNAADSNEIFSFGDSAGGSTNDTPAPVASSTTTKATSTTVAVVATSTTASSTNVAPVITAAPTVVQGGAGTKETVTVTVTVTANGNGNGNTQNAKAKPKPKGKGKTQAAIRVKAKSGKGHNHQ